MTTKSQAAQKDKYYTRPEVAERCWSLMRHHLSPDHLLIEPSAGSGVWLRTIEAERDLRGYDLYPDRDGHPAIQRLDFLADDLRATFAEQDQGRTLAVVGNPPFGHRCRTAVDFLNKALGLSDVVGFIVPVTFRKWSVQSKINRGACLIADYDLPEAAFTLDARPYAMRCCFQIWSRSARAGTDLRASGPPARSHPDFEMEQWNCTDGARHVFDERWDFAVRRQGRGCYTPVLDCRELNRGTQWVFFRSGSLIVRRRLLSIDFEALSRLNSKTPGLGKADVVAAYRRVLAAEQDVATSLSQKAANSNAASERDAA